MIAHTDSTQILSCIVGIQVKARDNPSRDLIQHKLASRIRFQTMLLQVLRHCQ